jgi:transposase
VEIIALHHQGLGIKAIARRLGISRNAVRRALRRNGPPQYRRETQPSKLDPFKDYLIQRLTDFPELSCERLLEEIKKQGYTGGKTILKDFTLPLRVKRREPVVRFETAPGEQAQVDWSHLGRHAIDGQEVKLYLFAMVLGFSRCTYAEVTKTMDIEALIACHRRAFSYFGGTTAHVLYDNMKTVVVQRQSGGNHKFNPAFLDFAGSVGFSPKLCRPYRAKTKGKVERIIGYVKDSFLIGRTFTGIDDMNAQLLQWLDQVANVRIHATTGEAPFVRLREENLLPVSRRLLMQKTAVPTKKPRPMFLFKAPEVERRCLSVYEEVAR